MPKTKRAPRKRKVLTHASILAMRFDPKGYPEHSDAGCPGLRVAVFRSGYKSFILRYRKPGSGRNAKLSLGEFDDRDDEQAGDPKIGGLLTLSAARKLATDCKRAIKMGRDPGEERRLDREGQKSAHAQDFEWACRAFILDYSKPKNRRWRDTARLLGLIVTEKDGLDTELRKGSLVHRWRDRPISAITKREVMSVLAEPARRGAPFAANAMQVCLRKMWNWLISEHDMKMENPLWSTALRIKPIARDRVLTNDEIRAFWRACATVGAPFGGLFKMLLTTGQRRDEVARLTYAEISPDRSTWTLARVRTKNGTAHIVPLSELARGLIPTQTGKVRYAFTTTGRTPVSGFSKLKFALDREMLKELRKIKGDDTIELEPWRLHDLRRTCATGLAELAVRQEVTEAILNHKSGKVSGVAGIYNRYAYDAEKRQALDAWAKRLQAIVAGLGNVLTFQREAAE